MSASYSQALGSFDCLILSSTWFKVFTSINYRNAILQARAATLDVEVDNLKSLIDDLRQLRDSWDAILAECKIVAEDLGMVSNGLSMFLEKRRRRRARFVDETSSDEIRDSSPEDCFKRDVFMLF